MVRPQDRLGRRSTEKDSASTDRHQRPYDKQQRDLRARPTDRSLISRPPRINSRDHTHAADRQPPVTHASRPCVGRAPIDISGVPLPPSDACVVLPRGCVSDCGPVRQSNWRRRVWNAAVANSGVDPDRPARPPPHSLRHTAVPLWISAGASFVEIAQLAGHASASLVLDRYGHLLPADKDALVDRLEDR
jgi:hypothetical protein